MLGSCTLHLLILWKDVGDHLRNSMNRKATFSLFKITRMGRDSKKNTTHGCTSLCRSRVPWKFHRLLANNTANPLLQDSLDSDQWVKTPLLLGIAQSREDWVQLAHTKLGKRLVNYHMPLKGEMTCWQVHTNFEQPPLCSFGYARC